MPYPEFMRMALRHLAAALAITLAAAPALAADPVPMLAHRASYNLVMDSSKGGEVTAATGKMDYELTDACEGWATRQRLAMTLTNRDGQDIESVADYATFESKDGLSMRFRMRQTLDTAVTEQIEGTATLDSAGGPGTIRYTMPEAKTMPLPAGTVFPMGHTDAIIAAASAGKRFIALPVFDGTGDRGVQDSSVAIAAWGPGGASTYPALADMAAGRVRIAFFDREKAPGARERVAGSPDYEVGMKYWANGVSDDLQMDFTDFVMRGKLSEFTPLAPHC